MITPALLEELQIWELDPYFINSIRHFNHIHEQTVDFGYDPFLPENHYTFSTDASGFRIGVFDHQTNTTFARQLGLTEASITDIVWVTPLLSSKPRV